MKRGQKKRNLSDHVNALIDRSVIEGSERVLLPKAVSEVGNVSRQQVYRIWNIAKKNAESCGINSATPQKKGKCGRKAIYDDEGIAAAVKNVPLNKRGTMRSLANEIGVSTNVIQRKKAEGVILSHSSAIKPHLREDNKYAGYLCAMNRARARRSSAGIRWFL